MRPSSPCAKKASCLHVARVRGRTCSCFHQHRRLTGSGLAHALHLLANVFRLQHLKEGKAARGLIQQIQHLRSRENGNNTRAHVAASYFSGCERVRQRPGADLTRKRRGGGPSPAGPTQKSVPAAFAGREKTHRFSGSQCMRRAVRPAHNANEPRGCERRSERHIDRGSPRKGPGQCDAARSGQTPMRRTVHRRKHATQRERRTICGYDDDADAVRCSKQPTQV